MATALKPPCRPWCCRTPTATPPRCKRRRRSIAFAERKAEIARQLLRPLPDGQWRPPHRRRRAAGRSDCAGRAPQCARLPFEAQFLDVPQECPHPHDEGQPEVLPLLDAAGKLTNKFLVVSNISPEDASFVRRQARGAPAPGRRQILLRPGSQEDPGLARGQPGQGGLPQQAGHARASAWSACAPSPKAIRNATGRRRAGAAGRPGRAAARPTS